MKIQRCQINIKRGTYKNETNLIFFYFFKVDGIIETLQSIGLEGWDPRIQVFQKFNRIYKTVKYNIVRYNYSIPLLLVKPAILEMVATKYSINDFTR